MLSNSKSIQDFIDAHTKRSIEELHTKEALDAFLNDKSSKRVLIGSNNSTLIELLREKESAEDILSANGVARVKLISDITLLGGKDNYATILGQRTAFPFIAFLKDDRFPRDSELAFFTNANIDETEEVKEFISIETLDLVYKLTP